ncbi:MAG: type domain [Thermoanaerobaculia bacterium]|jgi:hypothetical protein|nr:type domain [Thermoanaerobaculia bacterium]
MPTDVINEQSSLLDISRGATIVSRTGEFMLPASAMNTIDGEIATFWSSPPRDFPQSIVIALGARSRIDRIGIRSLAGGFEVKSAAFETSLDGTAWQPLATITSKHADVALWQDVSPAEAAYLRITIPEALIAGRDARLNSLFAHGAEVAPHIDPALEGCWSVNGSAATFAQHGSYATGVLVRGYEPFFIEGASNGRLWRFNWIRGNDYGFTALTIAPDGKHLSALEWHEEAIPLFRGMPWFGERAQCSAPAPRDDVNIAVLSRAGHVALFGLQFDSSGQFLQDASREQLQALATMLRLAPPVTLVAHEFRQPDTKRNQEVAQREIDSLKAALTVPGTDMSRISFRAAGSEGPRHVPESDAARTIYSSIEVEVRR